jgi:hypothetical protein
MPHYRKIDIAEEMFLWKVADDVTCPSKHPIDSPGNQLANRLKH